MRAIYRDDVYVDAGNGGSWTQDAVSRIEAREAVGEVEWKL